MHNPEESVPAGRAAPPRRDGPRHAARADAASPPPGRSWPPAAARPGSRAAHRRRRRAGRTGAPRHRGRWVALGLALTAVAAVLVVDVVRNDDGAGRTPAGSAAARSAGAPDPPPALLDWLRTELPDGGTVAAPPDVRAALLRAGAEDAVLPESPAAAGNAATPALTLVETPPAGSRLLARFDRDGAPPLCLVDPAPVAATAAQRRQRETLAAAVLANPTTRTAGDTRGILAAADVDARLLAVVAALTAREGVGLRAFPELPGEAAGSAPARRVVVDALGGRPVPVDEAATRELVAWLEAQLAPFAPDAVEVTRDGVLVGFSYVPGPDAVVAAATS